LKIHNCSWNYLEFILLSKFSLTKIVSTLGTTISQKKIQLLLLYTSEIVFCFEWESNKPTSDSYALENSFLIMLDRIKIKFLFLLVPNDFDFFIRKKRKSLIKA
jgi:hypothetical protein